MKRKVIIFNLIQNLDLSQNTIVSNVLNLSVKFCTSSDLYNLACALIIYLGIYMEIYCFCSGDAVNTCPCFGYQISMIKKRSIVFVQVMLRETQPPLQQKKDKIVQLYQSSPIPPHCK